MGPVLRRSLIAAAVLAGALALWWVRSVLPSPRRFNANDETVGALSRSTVELKSRAGDTAEAESFRLVLPESRVKPGGNRIRVGFERLRTTATEPKPPVFVLAGGPGSSGTELGHGKYFYLFREIQKYADVVLIDQRGAGLSVPSLRIPGELDLVTEADVEATVRRKLAVALAGFRNKGIDVTAYNSRESADDLDEIRAKLGYETITLLGLGYGTELSMVYLDRHSERVAGAVWLGPIAPDLALKLPGQVQRQLERLEQLVGEDRRLKKLIPHLTDTVSSVHASLESHPVRIRVPLNDALISDEEPALLRGIFSTVSGLKPEREMTLARLQLELIVQDDIGSDDRLERLPVFYDRLARGDYRRAGIVLSNFRSRPMRNALMLTTNCTTGYTDARWQLALEQQPGAALSAAALRFGRERDFCDSVGLPRLGDEFLRPIASDVRVLFIAGTLDGTASIENLPELRRRFPNNATITVENGGYDQWLNNTSRDGILAFLRGEPPPVTVVRRRVQFESPVPYERSVTELLDELLQRDGREAAATRFRALVAQHADDEEYQCDVSEEGLNNYGYELLARGRHEDAIAMFRLNVELHPDSWNAHDSLGEGLQRSGHLEEAQRSYEKSLELNFLNVSGRRHLRTMRM